jgi:hypothetical protein
MANPFENRRWLVIPSTIVESINFDQVHEFNESSLRYSLDGSQTFVKYDINIVEEDIVQTLLNPESMVEETFTTPAGIYGRPSIWSESYPELTHEEIITLLSTEAWSEPLAEV